MTMLIKDGLIHTMTAQGSFVGDILVREDRIETVAPDIRLDGEERACILNAEGLTILPGLMDVHIHEGPEMEASCLHSTHASGVTCGLLWPEQEGRCRLLMAYGVEDIPIYAIQPGKHTDEVLQERFRALAADDCRIACEIHNSQECGRVLKAVHSTGIKAILVHLTGCETLLDDVARSGCPVVLGVNHHRSGNPWEMACRLLQLGVQIALTCNHPYAKLCHLPLCAALCTREGMDRERALHMITAAPATISGLSGRGAIEAGARADFAIYDGDPLLLATSHVMTIAGGKIRH